ncbi:MAG: class I SAM-dependent methyltransferase, partial [Gaiellaceae bacterium]
GAGGEAGPRRPGAGLDRGAGGDLWSGRAEAFRASPTHAVGEDLDLLIEWCEPGPGVRALDVATGGGHVARRLREAGCEVVSLDPAPGMQPDVIARAEQIPFADASFDVVACRIAPHHFDDVVAAVKEMARVAGEHVVIEDNLFFDEASEEAERLRDPSHVRCYGQPEWTSFFELAGLEVVGERRFDRSVPLQAWLDRVQTPEPDAGRVRELLAHRIHAHTVSMATLVIKGRKS